MNGLLGDALVVLTFILLGALFVAAEIALLSLRESQTARLADRGRRGRILADLQRDPNRFLAAVQVGVTLAGFVSAGFGASRIAPRLVPQLESWGLSEGVAGTVAFIGVTLIVAYVSLVLGELVPKRLALQRAEAISMVAAAPVEGLARITRPFIWLLSRSTNAVVRLLGGDPNAGREQMTEEELRGLLATHAEIGAEERRVIDDVFDAGDRELREVMVPRTEVTFLDVSLTTRQAIERMTEDAHSRYPVTQGSVDDVVGYLHVRDVLLHSGSPTATISSMVRPVLRCPGTRTVLSVLADMRRSSQHMAIVVDEYGGTAGIVTMQDLVEELVGGLHIEPWAGDDNAQRDVELDGLLNIEDFADVTGVELPEGPYETVAGFIVSRLGHLPRVGDVVEVDRCRLEVLTLDGRRAARLRVFVAATDMPE